jgi:hypothetical protein
LFYTHGLMTRACLSAPIAARHTHRKLHLEQHVLADIFLSLYPVSFRRCLSDIGLPNHVLYHPYASTVSTLHSGRRAKTAINIVTSTVSTSNWLQPFLSSLNYALRQDPAPPMARRTRIRSSRYETEKQFFVKFVFTQPNKAPVGHYSSQQKSRFCDHRTRWICRLRCAEAGCEAKSVSC